jgi:hypothetical protein
MTEVQSGRVDDTILEQFLTMIRTVEIETTLIFVP